MRLVPEREVDPTRSQSEDEVLEVRRRIGLQCPLLQTRIQTPVRGHKCQHLQCFDLQVRLSLLSLHICFMCPLALPKELNHSRARAELRDILQQGARVELPDLPEAVRLPGTDHAMLHSRERWLWQR